MSKKILIIENEQLIAKAYGGYLTKLGYDVQMAFDGQAGLELVEKDHPDLILLDIVMPNMDGITVLKKLRADQKTEDIPVIMLTNLNTHESVSEALNAGITNYLVKVDYSLEDLGKKIKEVLDQIYGSNNS